MNMDHLSTEEIRAVVSEVRRQYLSIFFNTDPEVDPVLRTQDYTELGEEYDVWVAELQRRIGYANSTNDGPTDASSEDTDY